MPTDAPDLDAEQDVDLRRHWDTITRHWWIVLGGLAAGIIVGYLISLGGGAGLQGEGGRLPRPAALAGRRAGAEPGDEPFDGEGDRHRRVDDREGRPRRRPAAGPAARAHLDAGGLREHLAARPEPARRDHGHRPRPPAGRARRERPGADGRLLGRAGELLEDEDRQPAAAGRPGEGDAEHAERQPEGAAGSAQGQFRSLDERAADRARPAQRLAGSAVDDHRPAHHQPAAARARQGRRGAGDHDPRRGDEDHRAQPPQHGARRGADRPDPRHRRRAALRARRSGPSAATRSVQACSTESGCRSSSPRTTRRS